MMKSSPLVIAETDNVFYYSNWKKGVLTLSENNNYAQSSGYVCAVNLKDKDGVVLKAESGTMKDKFIFEFDVSLLKNIGEAYTLEYSCRSANGSIAQGTKKVYRYDRPSYVMDDNSFKIDGKTFVPVMGYHVQPSDYDYCIEAGINVIQYFPKCDNDRILLNQLDEANKKGLKVFVALYGGLTLECRQHIVNVVKQHPSVFGYMLYDEPSAIGITLDELEEMYKIVRNNDSIHPTYIVEAQTFSLRYGEIAKYTDIFSVDPYAIDRTKALFNSAIHVALAKEATHGLKPVMCINGILTKLWRPSADDVRNMNYQALFAGANGIGYYDVRDIYGYNKGQFDNMWQRESYRGITAFAKKEMSIAFDAFVLHKFKLIIARSEGDIWYQCFDTGSGIYCVVINRTLSEQTAKVELANGINNVIRVINGAEPGDIRISGSSISVKLGGSSVAAFWVIKDVPLAK
jgi:hypothetical protein